MALYRSAPIVAFVLSALLSSCSSTSPTTPEKPSINQADIPASDVLTASSASPDQAVVTVSQDLVVASDDDVNDVDHIERILRPPLAADNDFIEPVLDALPDDAEVSYVILDLERGLPIAEYQADRDHIPASTAKIATAVAALQLLGPNHRFQTEIRATGPVENGIIKGDLILKGGGDPVLDIPDLLPLIEGLVEKGVHGIDGRFLIDDTLLPRFSEIEPTQPTEAAYNPGLGALSLAFNRVKLQWKKRGDLSIQTLPHLDEASFEAAAADRLPPSGVQLKSFDGDEAVWQLMDRGSRRTKRSLPVKDPGLHAGLVFADLAKLYGVHLPAPERIGAHQESQRIAVHESRPLRELVRDMLWYSNNLLAELIGLSSAKILEPELDSIETSAGVIVSELQRQLPDVAWDNAWLDNHSGLSSTSRMTPEQLAAILRHGWQEGMISSLLPGSGWSGTLARRFNGPDQAFRIWAKTGSINYVSALGGYLLSPSHSPAAFVIMISDDKARKIYDAQPHRTRKSEKKAHAWKNKAEAAMNVIIEHWLEPATTPSSESLVAMSAADQEDAR